MFFLFVLYSLIRNFACEIAIKSQLIMKQKLLLSLFVLFTATIAWADVEINETNFPDEIFRGFLLEQEYGSDGVLTNADIAGVTSIDVNIKDIQSLKGIEFFTALTKLCCSANQLTELDVSKNTALTFLSCSNNQLTELDVSLLSALDTLNCWANRFTSLDVSKNTALKYLDCSKNQLTSLDVSQNTALTTLNCWENQITSLDVSKNTALDFLYCNDNQLTSLDVSKNTALTKLGCSNNQLTSLDVSQNTALTILDCCSNPLKVLDVSNNTALEYLECIDIQLTSLDVSQNTALVYLVPGFNQLTTLDVSKNTALETLYCTGNQLTSLDVSKNTALTDLSCCLNQITGENMDALVESLPTVIEGAIWALYYEDEQNVMTAKQAAVAKAKGWQVLVCSGLDDEGEEIWDEYKGGDGIGEIQNSIFNIQNEADAIYDLGGCKINGQWSMINGQLPKGLYIVGGRKVLK